MLYLLYISVLICLVNADYQYETKWFNVPLDHFGFQRNETFNIKYLVNDSYWLNNSGPIFFYTGNEGQIEQFAKHTGFIWETAPEYRAKIVFAEHRYYGASRPFGDKSLDSEHIGYLTSAQALADYADLINYLQGNGIKPRYPVIVFGGSYGGMLSAYMRIKYPHLVIGAIAASAPVHMFPGMSNCDIYNRLVTSSFNIVNKNCSINIRNSWSIIRNYSLNANGSEWLHKNWNLCKPVKNSTDLDMLLDYMNDMYSNLAMVNYPFASDFLVSLPAEPVRVVCQYLSEQLTGENLLQGIGKVLDIYANYGKKKKVCVDYSSGDNFGNLDAAGWDYQACTEMVMPMCSNGNTDMFEPSPWNFTKFSEDCHKKYNVYPRQNMARLEYGGNKLQAASNIVFSNGLRDPWTGGGILESLSDTIRAIIIVDAAHHLDLMPSNPSDPDTVRMARNIHKQYITKWIKQFREELSNTRTPQINIL